ncbi:hypothetical protein D3C80_1393720 [compost metagenome]
MGAVALAHLPQQIGGVQAKQLQANIASGQLCEDDITLVEQLGCPKKADRIEVGIKKLARPASAYACRECLLRRLSKSLNEQGQLFRQQPLNDIRLSLASLAQRYEIIIDCLRRPPAAFMNTLELS